jgi:ubiquinone/menaquinone biosynthesis C-methylase UbiE
MYPTTFGKFVEPGTVSSHFHLREGDKVADFGAGSGHFMKPLSALVGKSGSVYLCEIQRNLVDALGIRANELHLTNVHPMWCDFEAPGGIKLGDDTLDAGLLSNTLFQLTNKEVSLREVARVLRKGGKLFIIDWTDSFGGMGPQPGHVVTETEAKATAEKAGLSFEHTFPAGDHHYGLVFRKT